MFELISSLRQLCSHDYGDRTWRGVCYEVRCTTNSEHPLSNDLVAECDQLAPAEQLDWIGELLIPRHEFNSTTRASEPTESVSRLKTLRYCALICARSMLPRANGRKLKLPRRSEKGGDVMTLGTLLLILLAFVYFMPSIMAYRRGHQNTGMIFLINLLRGWTVLGWIGTLVWAANKVEKPLDKKTVWWNHVIVGNDPKMKT